MCDMLRAALHVSCSLAVLQCVTVTAFVIQPCDDAFHPSCVVFAR
jgi:hypothetical protein